MCMCKALTEITRLSKKRRSSKETSPGNTGGEFPGERGIQILSYYIAYMHDVLKDKANFKINK